MEIHGISMANYNPYVVLSRGLQVDWTSISALNDRQVVMRWLKLITTSLLSKEYSSLEEGDVSSAVELMLSVLSLRSRLEIQTGPKNIKIHTCNEGSHRKFAQGWAKCRAPSPAWISLRGRSRLAPFRSYPCYEPLRIDNSEVQPPQIFEDYPSL